MPSTNLRTDEINGLSRCVWWAEQAIRGICNDGDMPTAARQELHHLARAKRAMRKIRKDRESDSHQPQQAMEQGE